MSERFKVEPAPHICVECLEDDCDCGGSELACNGCAECQFDDAEDDEDLNAEIDALLDQEGH